MRLSENDAPHMIVIPEKEFGMSITLFHKAHTVALGRELEVTLNSSGLDGKAARARLASLTKRAAQAKPATRNQIENAVRYLARYGWQLRDAHHPHGKVRAGLVRGGAEGSETDRSKTKAQGKNGKSRKWLGRGRRVHDRRRKTCNSTSA